MEEDQVYLPGDDGQLTASSLTKIQEMLESGEYNLSDPAWMEGWDNYGTLADVPSLQEKIKGEETEQKTWKQSSKEFRSKEEVPGIVIALISKGNGAVTTNAIIYFFGCLMGLVWATGLLMDGEMDAGTLTLNMSLATLIPTYFLWRSTRGIAQFERSKSLSVLKQAMDDREKFWLYRLFVPLIACIIAIPVYYIIILPIKYLLEYLKNRHATRKNWPAESPELCLPKQ